MFSQTTVMERLVERISDRVVENISQTITQTVERELQESLYKALIEGEFYREMSEEMRGGLQTIYREIKNASRSDEALHSEQTTEQLFTEASRQLDDILATTEEATVSIMDVVEKHMELQNKANDLLAGLRKTRKSNPAIQELIEINDELGANLVHIMTSLSFQDLTGQRIKKIINALKTIESTVFELYLSTGLTLKAREEAPDKDIESIREESKAKMTQLKGPQREATQDSVDDLLSQLGLE
ncbi:MAG: protein phosphatase CheZ [Oceanidesulfovibrio sp.]